MRGRDIVKIQTLGRRARSGMAVLENLYKLSIVRVRKIEEWTGLSRQQANELIKRTIEIGMLM